MLKKIFSKKITKIMILAAMLLAIGTPLGGCASTARCSKTMGSDLSGGLNRIVYVYSADGKLIKTYEGQLDIEDNEYGNKVLFDLNGKRVVLFNCSVITEEK